MLRMQLYGRCVREIVDLYNASMSPQVAGIELTESLD
jgi:hypothetical protein